MVPALFCATQYLIDRRYLPGEKETMDTRRLGPRMANVELGAAAVTYSADYKRLQALQVIRLRNIKVVEELIPVHAMKTLFG